MLLTILPQVTKRLNIPLYRHYCKHASKPQLSYSFMPGDMTLLHSTFGKVLDKAASEAGDTVALVVPHQGIRKTYLEFKNDVDKLASGLISLGLQKGDRVGLCSPNIYEWPVAQFATAKAGLIMANINPAYQADELEYCLNKVQCKALITSEIFKTQNFYEMLCSFLPEVPNSKPGDLQAKRAKNLKSIILLSDTAKSGTITFNDLFSLGNNESDELLHYLEDSIQFDDPVNIQFTSGTTGSPKGATLTHHNVINNAHASSKRLGYYASKQIVCCQVPLYHCFGCVLGTLSCTIAQQTCVFPSPSFDAIESIKIVEKERCTTIYGTPTMFVDFIHRSSPENDLSSLNQAIIGGASCPESVLKDIYTKLDICHIHHAYGSTENSPVVSMNFLNDPFETVLSSYIPTLDFVELKVVDSDGCLVPTNTSGEICTRGHILFHGYWDEEKKTKEVVSPTNWYYSGDIGHMNENGYIKITGRKKDMVLRGGENIYPLEIENFLHKNPAILEAHVCGVPDLRMGEEICVWIKLKDGEKLSQEDVKAYCRGKISHFKIPRYIMFVDDFPKTVSGKIQKFKMREQSIKTLSL